MPKICSAVLLILAMGPIAHAAFSADVAVSSTGDAQTTSSAAESADGVSIFGAGGSSGSGLGGNSAAGIGQQSVTAGYELGGQGVAVGGLPMGGGILTAPGKGMPIRFENGIFVYPSALIGFGRNNNVLGKTTNKVASNIWVLQPAVVGELKRAGDRYTLSYQGNYGRYTSDTADDYNHHELWLAGDNYFTARARLGWGIGYLEQSDARGATNRAISTSPDRWHAPVVRALGVYGAPGAIGRIELEGSWMQKRYENNRSYTAVADVDVSTASGRFFYRIMPKTSLVFEGRETLSRYQTAISSDNDDLRLYTGVTWLATAKTTGTLKFGREFKSFADATHRSSSLPSWESSIQWLPLTYSIFDLKTSKGAMDSNGLGNYVTNTATTLTWNHKWATFISSRVNAGLVKTTYDGNARKDDTKNYGLAFYRDIGYNARLGLDWSHTNRNSNDDLYDFERDVLMLTLEVIL